MLIRHLSTSWLAVRISRTMRRGVCCHLRSGAPTPGIECRTTSSMQVGAAIMDFPADPHPHQAPEQALERCANEQTHAASRRVPNGAH
jgi:hypothetical protein